jgi:hypothetical protein
VNTLGFINMGVFTAKPGKKEELAGVLKEISQYLRSYPEKFETVKSARLFSRSIGGVYGEYVYIWEFESWADYSEYEKNYGTDETYAGLMQKLIDLVEPSSHSWTNLSEVRL